MIGARTLFATHYHELTAMADELPRLRNVTVAVDDADDRLAFLYRVVPGAADRSYGVQVARLAGLPAVVTDRAAALLDALEHRAAEIAARAPVDEAAAEPSAPSHDGVGAGNGSRPAEADVLGARHFREWHVSYESSAPASDGPAARLLGELLGLDLSSVTPLRALNLLHEMQEAARGSLPWPPKLPSSWFQVPTSGPDSEP